jgi:hypothetical protein
MAENPYEPPKAVVADRYQVGPAGGTLEGGIAGEYDLKISAVLGEAWRRTRGLKGSFWAAAIVVFLVIFVINFAVGLFAGAVPEAGAGMLLHFLLQIGLSLVIYPFLLGLLMLSVRHVVELPIGYSMAFAYFGCTWRVLLAALLMTIITFIGFLLLVLPGIYLSFAYMLTLPLIAEKGLGSWRAMEASRRAVTAHWFKVFFLFVIMSFIIALSVIPLGIGLIWTYPMLMNVIAIIYREAFGVEAARVAA